MAQDWFPSPLGPINFESNRDGLVEIGWGEVVRKNPEDITIETTRKWIASYFDGVIVELPCIDDKTLTKFQRNILVHLRDNTTIGETITYAELAESAGHPGASRAVGSVMAMNPWPILIPCHRVVRGDGIIGNYSGLGGTKTKTRLLIHEGRKFDENGKLVY